MMHPFYDGADIDAFLDSADRDEVINFIRYTKNWKRPSCYLRDEERILGEIPPNES